MIPIGWERHQQRSGRIERCQDVPKSSEHLETIERSSLGGLYALGRCDLRGLSLLSGWGTQELPLGSVGEAEPMKHRRKCCHDQETWNFMGDSLTEPLHRCLQRTHFFLHREYAYIYIYTSYRVIHNVSKTVP